MTDPRAVKRERRTLRRDLLRLVAERLGSRRCFWTWPFGHDWGPGRFLTTSPTDRVTRCRACGKPCSWESFDVYDIARFAERNGLATDEELEPFFDRWRELP